VGLADPLWEARAIISSLPTGRSDAGGN
jgi:hypothetical protein